MLDTRTVAAVSISSGLQSVTFIFVPGHTGVSGNKSADRLASLAPNISDRVIDWADLESHLRKSRIEDL